MTRMRSSTRFMAISGAIFLLIALLRPHLQEAAAFPEGCTLGPMGGRVCIFHRWEELPDGRRVECMVLTGKHGRGLDCNWGTP